MPAHASDAIGAAMHKLADKLESNNEGGRRAAWDEVAELYNNSNMSPAEKHRLSENLEKSGILPRLLVDVSAAINDDADGDEDIQKWELENRARNVGGEVNPATQMAAQYALDNFDAIDVNDDDELAPEELKKWQQDHPGEKHPNDVFAYEENDPESGDDILPESKEYYQSVLQRPYASEQEKLKAVEGLAKLGETEVELKEPDGSKRTYRVQVESAGGGRRYVHLWDTETNQIVLRGIGKDGQYQQERDRRGNPVPFQGSRWSRGPNRESDVIKVEN